MLGANAARVPQQTVLSALRDPFFYATERVDVRETEISWVFLAGDRAFKLKKPVRLPFLDYSTPRRRRHMCEEEVRLNRRLAPSVYIGVRSLLRDDHGGLAWGDAEDGRALDYVVEMRRFAERDTMAATLGRAECVPITAIARRLAGFHTGAQRLFSTDPLGSLRRSLDENFGTLRGLLDEAQQPILGELQAFSETYLAANHGLFSARAEQGLVRDGHGDLRAQHVLLEKEQIEIVDCVEFAPALRHIDVASDLAFLVMDLTRLGAAQEAEDLVNSYRAAGGDPGPPHLVAFFAIYRALVRAKTLLLGDPTDRARQAGPYVTLAEQLAWQARKPILIVVSGVSASGKSVIAEKLSRESGLPHLNSDLLRKELTGLAPTARGGAALYTETFTRRVYSELGQRARMAIEKHGGAIVDATFTRALERAAFDTGYGELPHPVILECVAPRETLLARVRAREEDAERVSDATAEVLRTQLARREPWPAEARATELSADVPFELMRPALAAALNAHMLSRAAAAGDLQAGCSSMPPAGPC